MPSKRADAAFRQRHPHYKREWMLKERYGLTLAAWNALFAGQGHACAVCQTKDSGGHGWHTDHNHETGVVRGILCFACNTGIGKLGDDPERLRAAADYLDSKKVLH